MAAVDFQINTRRMRYPGDALAALKNSGVETKLKSHEDCKDRTPRKRSDSVLGQPSTERNWLKDGLNSPPPRSTTGRNIGKYPLTSEMAPWVKSAFVAFDLPEQVRELVEPFTDDLHAFLEKERNQSTGLHDLDALELAYQYSLEVGAALLLAGDATKNPVDRNLQLHATQADGGDHFASWGRLLTGLECDPPIIGIFPFFLLLSQAFTLEPNPLREDYIYAALTGVDWAKGENSFNDRIRAFEALAHSAVPSLDKFEAGMDRCFWRIAHGYLRSMNDCENVRPFQYPRTAAIEHNIDMDLLIAARAFDGIAAAYATRDGACFLDNEGMDSLLATGVVNDVMDLHHDVFTGETRNCLRFMYPPDLKMSQAMESMSIVLTTTLCEIFRGHHRARLHNREDGRVSSASAPYSFSRARLRRVFKTLELYMDHYPQFWEWTWQIFNMAKSQMTEAALIEPHICAMKRSVTRELLPESPPTKFFNSWYELVEDGSAQLSKPKPLGVSEDVAPVVRELHDLWHRQLRDDSKKPGWGRKFDYKSDMLLGKAGEILTPRGGACEDVYRFGIAYGRMSMTLPYIAYHTIDAIIMAFGPIEPGKKA